MRNDEQLVARILEILAKADKADLASIEGLLSLGDKRVQERLASVLGPIGRATARPSRSKLRSARFTPQVYQIKVTLKHIKPPIWRRIQVRNDITLRRLHEILHVVMGWDGYHLHAFTIKGDEYGEPDPRDLYDADLIDERRVKLGAVVTGAKEKFRYTYDFGDDWEHELLVEKVEAPQEGVQYPICLKGKRATPPEDCGGPWGYAELLEAVSNPEHPEYAERREWLGDYFDPEEFDLEGINRQLQWLR